MNSLPDNRRLPDPVILRAPEAPALPLVFDSPHSGRHFPTDFSPCVDTALLRRGEDSYIDELYAAAPSHGATLIAANFPRTYIDPNRGLEDIDPALLAAPWPEPLAPSDKTARGAGLIWRRIFDLGDIYDRLLTVEEVQARIAGYWRPYHDALAGALDAAHADFGEVWHINCHSMPAMGDTTTEDGPVPRAQFVLGDRNGTTCEPALSDLVEEVLCDLGYEVLRNFPYKGVELVRRYSDPAKGRHSLQIEINRGLYMDEASYAKAPGFAKLRADLEVLIPALADAMRRRISG